MGIYLNLGNSGFQSVRNGEYIDKSGLISVVNSTINTEQRCSCVSRCRRFGKSLAAKMLCAYYDQSCNSRSLFEDLEIARDPQFEKYLNKFPVIYLDITNFTTRNIDIQDIASFIQKEVKNEVLSLYPEVKEGDTDDLMDVLTKVADHYGIQFVMIIDEWDAICREAHEHKDAMDRYVNLLRRLFKGSNTTQVFAAVYMTGILPIKKFNTQSALNNFMEYSMVEPRKMGHFFGFTKDEVRALATKYGMDTDELEKWYFEGLKDDIIYMLSGGRCKVNPTKFQNDMSIITSRDDVLTVLIHLGYLSYDWRKSECYIPNREVAGEMVNAVEANNWQPVVQALEASERLLQATLDGDAEAVASGIDKVHDENTSILSYNDENSLACVLSIAYYYSRNDYVVHRELATGKGFADLVLIPRKNVESPVIILELKYNKDADSAIEQIKRKQYPAKVEQYADNLLLVGINYDKKTKQHACRIERV